MKTTMLKQVQTAVQWYFVPKQFSYSTDVCVCYMQFAGYTNIVCSYVESTLYDLLQMMIPLLLSRQQGEEPTKRHMESGTAGEMSMPPFKCGCFSSAA